MSNSNTCISSGSVSLVAFFSSLWVLFSFFFACPVFDARHCEFCLIGCCIFCIPIDISKLCSETQLSYLKVACFFQVLLIRFVRWNQSSVQSKGNFCSLLWQDPSQCSTECPMNHEILQFSWWEQTPFLVSCEHQDLFPLIFLGISFSGIGQFPHMHVLISSLLDTKGEPSEGLQNPLCAASSSAVLCLVISNLLSFFDFQPFVLNQELYWVPPDFSLHVSFYSLNFAGTNFPISFLRKSTKDIHF